jgi:2-methylcitrate dehydratase PrpD
VSIAGDLAAWAAELTPSAEDVELADRSLLDTLVVTLAARGHEAEHLVTDSSDAARWATLGHVLDFDDLHMESTSHVSVVCVPTTLAMGGDARSYLAGAGVMARLGAALGWSHYSRGWHATCTAGAPAAAVAAAVALGLDVDGIATSMALAVPAAGGVQRAFGTSAKSLQVGFAAEAGIRAARLASLGASADTSAVDQWFDLIGGDRERLTVGGPAVPGGLAIKVFPCCYALQRPISAVRDLPGAVDPADVRRISVRTPASTVQPLIHSRPTTGLEAKFSLEYALAAAVVDGVPGFDSFTDAAVARPETAALVEKVDVTITPGGDWLLAGECDLEIELSDGASLATSLALPPGAPARPPSAKDMHTKIQLSARDLADDVVKASWADAPDLLREHLPR